MFDSNSIDQDYSTTPVPFEKRSSVWELMLVLSGGPICVAALYAGSSLSQGLTLWECAETVLSASFLLAIYASILGGIGVKSGLATGMLMRHVFGSSGSKIVAIGLALCLVGWYAVQSAFFGEAIHSLFPNSGILTESRTATIWGGLLMLTTAYLGYRGLRILSLVAVPLLFVLCIWGISAAISGKTPLLDNIKSPSSVASGITMIVGALAVGATITADITRFAKTLTSSWSACFTSFFLVNSFMVLGGVIITVFTGSGDLLGAMSILGLSVPALLILILGQWTTNDDNLYSASLGIVGAMPSLNKKLVVLILGVVATLVAALGISNLFVPFLITLGVTVPPVGGVITAHCLKNKIDPATEPEAISYIAFMAWIIGSATGLALPYGIPTVNSVATAFLIYYIFSKKKEV